MDPNPYAAPAVDVDQVAPAPLPSGLVLATRSARFLGALVDNLIYMVVRGAGPKLADMLHLQGPNWHALLSNLAVLAVASVQWWLIATTGQSIGKKALKTRIVKLDGAPAGFLSGVVLRSWVLGAVVNLPVGLSFVHEPSSPLGTVLLAVTSVVSLVDPLAIFGDARRCLHDYIAGTQVIIAQPAPPAPPPPPPAPAPDPR